MPDTCLEGKVALVTGGAQGLGAGICLALAQAGAFVIINVRPGGNAGDETAQAIAEAGGRSVIIAANISDGQQARELVKQSHAREGRLDILVNNAGITRDGLLLDMPEQAWDDVFATNARGAFNCLQAVTPYMIEQRAGSIVNVSSVVADIGSIGAVNYVASKGAINSLTRASALELARFNIRVNAVAPGVVETKLMTRVLDRGRDRMTKRIPLGRFAQPEEVAEVVVFLASERASYITGEVIRVAGGMGLAC